MFLQDIIKYNLAVDAIAAAEGIAVDDEDVTAEFNQRSAQLKVGMRVAR